MGSAAIAELVDAAAAVERVVPVQTFDGVVGAVADQDIAEEGADHVLEGRQLIACRIASRPGPSREIDRDACLR